MRLNEIAAKTAEEESLEQNCTGMVLAVSGGADSLAMLAWYASQTLSFPLTVAHVHHGLRKASDGEELLVREQCRRFGFPLRVLHTDVRAEKTKEETVEAAARRLRYEFFRTVAREEGYSHVATAHTLDDQAETVLLHLLHGAGPRGLCGILPKRTDGEITLIRPLLRCSRTDVEEYCRDQKLPYATDESNQDPAYTRNRIRHRLIPELKEYNPQITAALCRTAEAMQKQQEAMEGWASEFLSRHPEALPGKELAALPEGTVREILRIWFDRHGKTLSAEQTAQAVDLLKKPGGTVEFDRKWTLHYGQNRLTLSRSEKKSISPVTVIKEETLLPDGRLLRLSKSTVTERNRTQAIPCRLPLTARSRKNGDRIGTPGGTKSLAKRMMERSIPLERRDSLLLLADASEILWCEGLGSNSHTCPSPGEEGYFVFLSEQ